MTTARPAVVVRDVCQTYGAVHALVDVSLDVEEGAFHGIIGPNGAGKTTLMEIIHGARQPTSGTVALLGERPLPRNPKLLARIGIQPQRTAFLTKATVREHLSTMVDLYGAPRGRANEVLETMHLTGVASSRVDKLSGGERQKLAIASAIMHRPAVLFLDEPTATLDVSTRHDLIGLLRTVKDSGTTIIYTTHHLEEAERLCDVVTIVDHGRLVVTATPAKLIQNAHIGARILLPYAQDQIDVIRALGSVETVSVVPDGVSVDVHEIGAGYADLVAVGVDLSGSQVRSAGLEDAFLSLTGQEYRK
jgi:ABC-2 type transport system ATP-binding protein